MSAFLGPIHYWLYNKIKLQDSLTTDLQKKFADEEFMVLVNSMYECLPEGNLEDFIDTDNIHGWLQEKIYLVEKRLSFVVEVLCQKGITIEQIAEAAYEEGKKQTTLSESSNALDAYQFLNNSLLDGMPCDHINAVTSQEENCVAWNRSRNIHSDFWTDELRKLNYYDTIRDQWIRGFLAPTSLSYENRDNKEFIIKSK